MAQMRYLYTLGAMIMRYPLREHVNRNWVYKAYGIGLVLCLPLFAKITASIPEPKKKDAGHH
uniref:Isoform A n=1 Tax=Pseudodiaptomus poplesia TaxID=213370 RepID=A0A0U2LG96_9MAXI|nr:isoform A [Pseudodiaptomus poplesia]